MKRRTAISELAIQHGFHLSREKRHLIWVHPDGRVVVTSKSPKHCELRKVRKWFQKEN